MLNATSSPGPLPSTQHIDALYRLAHVLVGKERASDLVVETYQRATRHSPDQPPDGVSEGASGTDAGAEATDAGVAERSETSPPDVPADRLTLMRLMREAYADFKQAPAYPGAEDDAQATSYRRQTALRVVEQRLPLAMALLGRDERLILTLRDAQGLSTDEVASVIGQSPSATTARLEGARHALYQALRDVATPGEQRLFRDNLRESDIHASLQSMDTLGSIAVPTVLRARVAQVIKASATGSPPTGALPAAASYPALSGGAPSSSTSPAPSSSAPPGSSSGGSSHPSSASSDTEHGTPRAQASRSRTGRSRDRRADRSSKWGRRVRRFIVAGILIVVTAAAGYFISEMIDPAPEPDLNLIAVSARRAGAVPILLDTESREDAAQFVQDELSRRVEVPQIEDATFSGVGVFNIRDDVRVPVFVFDDPTAEQRLTVYAYSYATLDRLNGQMELAEAVREKLRDEEAITLERTEDGNALVWRQRDDIYVAVTYTDPEALRPRIGRAM